MYAMCDIARRRPFAWTTMPVMHEAGPIRARNACRQGIRMNLTLTIGPVASLIAGILILIVPRLLNYIVAAYLIIIGVAGIVGVGNFHVR
jgi:hypothetical protein